MPSTAPNRQSAIGNRQCLDRSASLPLIADPAAYQPSTIDLLADREGRELWLEIFEHHLPGLVKLAAASQGDTPDARERAARLGEEFGAILADYRRDPVAHGSPSVMRFCTLRQAVLLRQGFPDPYLPIKRCENAAAAELLPALLREIDAAAPARRLRMLIEGIFAGNIFDLGCAGTIAMYESGEVDFHAVRARLPKRPWCVDDFDALAARWDSGAPHRKAVILVDNAGADVTLGMVPFARELLRLGTAVVLTANTGPALNDITHAELVALIDAIAAFDPLIRDALQTGRLQLIASGNDIPLIDLSRITRELAEAAADADLLVIEGMGRALETNFRARFTADTLKLAMIKEPHVAATIGGKLYGVVCRYEPAAAR